jgi:hypothetical protein
MVVYEERAARGAAKAAFMPIIQPIIWGDNEVRPKASKKAGFSIKGRNPYKLYKFQGAAGII